MKSITGLWAVCLAAVLLLTAGCDRIPGMGPDVLIVDLNAIAKATGQDQAMQKQAQTGRADINARLLESAQGLQQQLEAERAKAGDTLTEEQATQLQQMTVQAQQKYAQLQAEAQQKVQQYEASLVQEFRERIEPFAEKIARTRGARVILLSDQSIFWHDTAVDVTDEVIVALHADNVFPENAADQDSAAPTADQSATDQPAVDQSTTDQ